MPKVETNLVVKLVGDGVRSGPADVAGLDEAAPANADTVPALGAGVANGLLVQFRLVGEARTQNRHQEDHCVRSKAHGLAMSTWVECCRSEFHS